MSLLSNEEYRKGTASLPLPSDAWKPYAPLGIAYKETTLPDGRKSFLIAIDCADVSTIEGLQELISRLEQVRTMLSVDALIHQAA